MRLRFWKQVYYSKEIREHWLFPRIKAAVEKSIEQLGITMLFNVEACCNDRLGEWSHKGFMRINLSFPNEVERTVYHEAGHIYQQQHKKPFCEGHADRIMRFLERRA